MENNEAVENKMFYFKTYAWLFLNDNFLLLLIFIKIKLKDKY